MGKAERLGVQRLTRTKVEAVVDELLVFLRRQSFQYFRTAVFLVVEERVSETLHVHAYLMRPPRLKPAFN